MPTLAHRTKFSWQELHTFHIIKPNIPLTTHCLAPLFFVGFLIPFLPSVQECQPFPCYACSGHGVCSDGLNGTGLCTCHSDATLGWWAGTTCSQCQPGVGGPDCATACAVVKGVLCTGHGTCGQGVLGTGQCTCFGSEATGFWDLATGCSTCLSGYYGADTYGVCCAGRALHWHGWVGKASGLLPLLGSPVCFLFKAEVLFASFCSWHRHCSEGNTSGPLSLRWAIPAHPPLI